MIIAAAQLTLLIPAVASLKGKRKALRSLKDRVKSRFNVAIAEVGALDRWQRAEIGVVTVGNDQRVLNAKMDKLLGYIESTGLVEPVSAQVEYIHTSGEWD